MSKTRTLNPYDMEARIHDLEENVSGGGGGGGSEDDYVSVTADGVKTVAQLLNDLFTAVDLTKLKNGSKAVRITDSATVVYHLVEYNSSSAYFSYDVVTADHWQILTFILKDRESSYRQVHDGTKYNKGTDVPTSGTVFRIYY